MTRRVATVLCPMATCSTSAGLTTRPGDPVTCSPTGPDSETSSGSPAMAWYSAQMPESSVIAGAGARRCPGARSSKYGPSSPHGSMAEPYGGASAPAGSRLSEWPPAGAFAICSNDGDCLQKSSRQSGTQLRLSVGFLYAVPLVEWVARFRQRAESRVWPGSGLGGADPRAQSRGAVAMNERVSVLVCNDP